MYIFFLCLKYADSPTVLKHCKISKMPGFNKSQLNESIVIETRRLLAHICMLGSQWNLWVRCDLVKSLHVHKGNFFLQQCWELCLVILDFLKGMFYCPWPLTAMPIKTRLFYFPSCKIIHINTAIPEVINVISNLSRKSPRPYFLFQEGFYLLIRQPYFHNSLTLALTAMFYHHNLVFCILSCISLFAFSYFSFFLIL